MSTSFKTFLRRFEVAIGSTILIIACQQFSLLDTHTTVEASRITTSQTFN
jgi:hypothetical protein